MISKLMSGILNKNLVPGLSLLRNYRIKVQILITLTKVLQLFTTITNFIRRSGKK